MLRRFLFALFFIALYALRYALVLPEFNNSYAGSFRGQEIILIGIASTPAEIIEAEAIEYMGARFPLSGKIELRGLMDELNYGDKVRAAGRLEEPMRNDPRIAGVMNSPAVEILSRGNGNIIFAALYELKNILVHRLDSLYPGPSAGLAAGILLGSRSAIPRDILDDFKRTGITHIIALSGFNIVILITFMEAVLAGLPRRIYGAVTILIIAAFVIMTGASASVLRAGIMGGLSIFARQQGRPYAALRALLITGYIMALADPFIAIYDIGFQLSFAATLGILVFAKRWQERFSAFPNPLAVRDTLIVTEAAQVFTLPLILYYFRGLSVIAPLANIIILPLIPILMLGGALSLLFGKIVAAPTYILFKLMLFIVHALASLPFAFKDFGIW